jgi:acyl-CoA dehydrogenase
MDFIPSARAQALRERLDAFMEAHVYPAEMEVLEAEDAEVAPGRPFSRLVADLRATARKEGLWNLFMPDSEHGPGLLHSEYALLCEAMGGSLAGATIFNCQPPDSGNMEILAEHGTPEQQSRWLAPLLAGDVRSCFSMTEPQTSGSDPTGLAATGELDGDEWVLNGRKWFTTGAVGASVAIAMVLTDPAEPPHARASMILVPVGTPGMEIVRSVSVMGHQGGPGHCEVVYRDCRVPAASLLGGRGAGFRIAQDRLGPGRIHHCMRALGAAERGLEMMCRRANERVAFGGPLGEKQFIQDFVARSRIEIDSARHLVLHAAWKMDTGGKAAARHEISMAKVAAPAACLDVLDRAIQVHGALGVTDDTPLALMWRHSRGLRLVDGADEVHKMAIARRELRKWSSVASG